MTDNPRFTWKPVLNIRHNSVDSLRTSALALIKMVSILNPQSRDLKHGGTFSNHCEVI